MILFYCLIVPFIFTGSSAVNKFIEQQNHKEIYLYIGDVGPRSESIIQEYQMRKIFLIGGGAIDPENNGTIDSESLTKEILRVIPDSRTTGIAILDWEGKSMENLNKLALTDPNFDRVVNLGQEMIRISKTLRPQIKWGIYALPLRQYWKRNEDWKSRNLRLIPLLKDCDVITPSVYKLYSDSALKSNNKNYLEDNVSLALQISKIINKPVLPFITHRLPNSKLISKDNFINDVDIIFQAHYLDKKIDGIIWWGPDEYYYRTKDKQLRAEVKNDSAFPSYFDNLIYNYLYSIVHLNSYWDSVRPK